MADEPEQKRNLNIKIDDETLKGRYANLVRIVHTREEFILDFVNMVPPQGVVNARIVTSPAHVKRLVQALSSNLKRYEESFGPIPDTPEPEKGSVN